jgi:hypothetical protein
LSALLPSVESAANDWIEPFLHDAAPHSNGGNWGEFGRRKIARYVSF